MALYRSSSIEQSDSRREFDWQKPRQPTLWLRHVAVTRATVIRPRICLQGFRIDDVGLKESIQDQSETCPSIYGLRSLNGKSFFLDNNHTFSKKQHHQKLQQCWSTSPTRRLRNTRLRSGLQRLLLQAMSRSIIRCHRVNQRHS